MRSDPCGHLRLRLLPEDPLRAGPHWLRTPWGAQVVRHWYPESHAWSDGLGEAHPDEDWRYIAPCPPPDDPPRPSLRGGSAGIANAAVVVEIKPSATSAHLRDMAAELTKMAEGRT